MNQTEQKEDKDSRLNLLLVDDEEGFVNVIANRLSKRGINTIKALNGTDAVQALRKQDFDVAVLDLKMEGMDGIEILKAFKKMAPEMPVIMLTGHGSTRAAKEGIEQGAFAYLSKPCELQELIEKIGEAISKGR